MEQRAFELSQKLSEMSGTEPIELIDRNESLDPVLYEQRPNYPMINCRVLC